MMTETSPYQEEEEECIPVAFFHSRWEVAALEAVGVPEEDLAASEEAEASEDAVLLEDGK